MKVREIIQNLEKERWYLARQKGSHKIYKHPNNLELELYYPIMEVIKNLQ
jgi:predicted RNA binding protein YcfA (HicA-like mRNA interferase family)